MRSHVAGVVLLMVLLCIPGMLNGCASFARPSPPGQPPDGPGGSNYSHAEVTVHQYGTGGWSYWLFEPAGPTPETAPVIVFNHGYAATEPQWYQAWVTHLVRRGNIVIYPRYQLGLVWGLSFATTHAIWAVRSALRILNTTGHVHPDLEKFAIVGHSLGGGITAEMAAKAASSGLPVPRAVMPVQPFIRPNTMLVDYHAIPAETLLLVVCGQDDKIAGNASGKLIFYTSDQIPLDRKDFVIQRTDAYGRPVLLATHGAPVCVPNSSWTDAMDYYSTWKLFDGLTDYAFYGTHREYCLGNTSQQRFMGLWSDGTPVRELLVTDTP